MVTYRPRSAADIRLRLLDYAVEDDTYSSVLQLLGMGIKSATARISEAEGSGSPDTAEFVTDAETEFIENLLGAAYVICQAQITGVTQAALRAREQAIKDGLTLSAFGDKPHDVRAFGEQFDSAWSKIEVLWALANYFKHCDEWSPSTWTTPNGAARYTVPVITAAGLTQGSTGNLRTGADALGHADHSDMAVFEHLIRDWSEEVRRLTRAAFGRS